MGLLRECSADHPNYLSIFVAVFLNYFSSSRHLLLHLMSYIFTKVVVSRTSAKEIAIFHKWPPHCKFQLSTSPCTQSNESRKKNPQVIFLWLLLGSKYGYFAYQNDLENRKLSFLSCHSSKCWGTGERLLLFLCSQFKQEILILGWAGSFQCYIGWQLGCYLEGIHCSWAIW